MFRNSYSKKMEPYLWVQQNVLGLQVSKHNPFGVHEIDNIDQTRNKEADKRFWMLPTLLDFSKLFSIHVVCYNVNVPWVLEYCHTAAILQVSSEKEMKIMFLTD